ncbi:MAG: flagellar basal-body rod protein FlgC [Acidimicrobiia bacterium]|nr:flagellar basal-body rod protein FlgC [Acidimicrobiia bacterium]
MSAPFAILGISASGMRTHKVWLDAIADNVANVSTVRPTDEPAFQERFVEAQAVEGGGVTVGAVRFGDPNGRLVHDPMNPLADANGMVRAPDMDLSDQMTHLIIAQRAYQANVTTFERVRDAYSRALELGK